MIVHISWYFQLPVTTNEFTYQNTFLVHLIALIFLVFIYFLLFFSSDFFNPRMILMIIILQQRFLQLTQCEEPSLLLTVDELLLLAFWFCIRRENTDLHENLFCTLPVLFCARQGNNAPYIPAQGSKTVVIPQIYEM